jgi:predicted HicB family RNase H-like nuclease
MKSLTLRIEDSSHDYVAALASASGLSINMTMEALIRSAQLAGVTEVSSEPLLRKGAGQ